MQEFTCPVCLDVFEAKRSDALTCSPKCRKRASRQAQWDRAMMEIRRANWSPQERQDVIDRESDARKANERQSHIGL